MDILFLWVPRSAGTSIMHWLAQHGGRKFTTNGLPLGRFDGSGIVSFGHRHIPSLVKREIVAPEFVEGAMKFTVVRNPFDRLISMAALTVSKQRSRGRELGSVAGVAETICRALLDGKVPALDCANERRTPGMGFIRNTVRPATDWLFWRGDQFLPDKVIKYEELVTGVSGLAMEIGWRFERIEHLHASQHGEYRNYFGRHLKMLAELAFRRDIELFGYDF